MWTVFLSLLLTPFICLASGIIIIGDSLIVGSQEHIRSFFDGYELRVDARVGRAFREGLEILKKQEGGRVFVINLFNNSQVEYEELEQAVRIILEKGAKVVFVTTHVPRHWREKNNTNIRLISQRYENVYFMDWEKVLSTVCDQQSCLRSDGVHLTREGSFYYALAIYLKVREISEP